MIEEALTFNDILLVPKYSDLNSRSEADVSVDLPKGFRSNLPIFPANMKSIMNVEVAKVIYKLGGIAFTHRFCNREDQLKILKELASEFGPDIFNKIGVSIGAKSEDYTNVDFFIENGVKIICLDIAHAHSKMAGDICQYINAKYPQILLVAGTIATSDGAKFLWKAGADMVRCNLGNGSICTTRLQSGVGVPQFTALLNINKSKKMLERELSRKLILISDGGCKYSGDVVKALTQSDIVMSGNMFAGCDETGTEVSEFAGQKFREYSGSSTHKNSHIEGVIAKVEEKGPITDIIQKILEGVRSGCSYQGVRSVKYLQNDPQYVRITFSGLVESQAHDVVVVK